jgi:pimeloyl-ACP methyl ester carboxylesterase
MMDSPVGIAAWIIEKFHSWSDTDGENIESAHSKDDLLTNIMIYIVTRTFNTASWIYYGRREEGGRILSNNGGSITVPTGCALFPKEMSAWPPQSYVKRMCNVQHWTEMPRGGHFGALEEPELLVEDIRTFARKLRSQ